MASDVAREYAARQEKIARFSAYLFASGIHSSQVMELGCPWWNKLAFGITRETGRKLAPPHSQETVDGIVQALKYFEDARAWRERADNRPFDVRF